MMVTLDPLLNVICAAVVMIVCIIIETFLWGPACVNVWLYVGVEAVLHCYRDILGGPAYFNVDFEAALHCYRDIFGGPAYFNVRLYVRLYV